MSEDRERTRTFSWQDPRVLAQAALPSEGFSYLQRFVEGGLARPPIAELFEMTIAKVEPGIVTFTMLPREYMYNPIGMVHGGALATILDSAIGCAVHSTLPAGKGYASLDLQVRFLRAVTLASGQLTATGMVIHAGRKVATGEATLRDANDILCATATSSCLIIDVAQPPASEP